MISEIGTIPAARLTIPATDLLADDTRADGPRNPWYLYVKTALDWTTALILAVLTAPMLLVLAVLVKLTSPGPIFYSQTRLGYNRRHYKIVKLRSMYHDCEAETGPVWAAKNDRRITPIGRILRETHLDEIPQLFNVLRGEMSLVGPRPERPELAQRIERTIPNFSDRLMVKPGVTGLAQMRLPADTNLEGVRKKLAHDLYYVRNVSFLLDLRIVLSTAFFFAGAAAHALCSLMVKSYGTAVEENLYDRLQASRVIAEEPCEVGAA